MKTKKIAKILGLGLAAALAFSLGAGIGLTPASADIHEWSTISTPTWEDNVILPGSDLKDMAIGESGDVIYVIASLDWCDRFTDWCDDNGGPQGDHLNDYGLFKSEDGGVTWDDITKNVYEASALPPCYEEDFSSLFYVAVAPDDEDWVAVVGRASEWHDDTSPGRYPFWVVASDDGGDNFTFAGEPYDTATDTFMTRVRDLAVSPEVDDIHNIALAGEAVDNGESVGYHGAIFRLEAGTWLSASWVNTAFYDGWDDAPDGGVGDIIWGYPVTVQSYMVIACDFSPNFDLDDTIVCMTAAENNDGTSGDAPYIQQGTWGSDNSWNNEAAFGDAILISDEGEELRTDEHIRSMGLALPADYDGTDGGARVIYCYVNAFNAVQYLTGGYLFRVDDGSVSEEYGPSGNPLLASIDFDGDADTGKMIIGEYVEWDNSTATDVYPGDPVPAEPCVGVNVWHTVELDPCCPDWELACKNPSGLYMALVSYTPDGEKAYAVTGGSDLDATNAAAEGNYSPLTSFGSVSTLPSGGAGDETAFSVSLDDGVSFNQTGLIDTDIDFLKDLAVCPDCSVIYLSTYNDGIWPEIDWGYGGSCGYSEYYDISCMLDWYAGCDSVWRSYDNGDTWERIFHGDWTDSYEDQLILRLPCDDLEDCCTIYLGIEDTDELYYSRDCGQCWTQTPGLPFDDLEDFTLESENIVYALNDWGEVTKSTQFGRRWSDPVDTEIGETGMITACCDQGLVLVSGEDEGQTGEVAYSEDGGETWELTDTVPDFDEDVSVACDPTCPGTIYAATDEGDGGGGIYRWVIGESETWADLGAADFEYEGIVVARDGTLYALSDMITIDEDVDCCYQEYWLEEDYCDEGETYSGLVRTLDPCDTACCGTEAWDYLITGLSGDCSICAPAEDFDMDPQPLKFCGCLSMDTSTVLYAIDTNWYYDVEDGDDGLLWTYEDCTAKKAPEIISPMCGEDIPSEPCEGCTNVDINLCWTNICDACAYDIEIATDEDFTQTVMIDTYDGFDGLVKIATLNGYDELSCFEPASCADPCFLIPSGALQAGTTYYWRVRVSKVETGECVTSQWSETCSFNVMAGAGAGVSLLAPEPGATCVGIESVAFSWSAVGGATSYSFVFSPNSDLSGALASEELSSTAYTYTGMLDYATPYFWQVTAWKNGSELSTSDIGTFTTMSEPPPPPEPAPEPTPPPEVVIPPTQQITPNWIIAVVAIGAALIVVVIVFIVRSRRP